MEITRENIWKEAENLAKARLANRQTLLFLYLLILLPVVFAILFTDFALSCYQMYLDSNIPLNPFLKFFAPWVLYVLSLYFIFLRLPKNPKADTVQKLFIEILNDKETELEVRIEEGIKEINKKQEELANNKTSLGLVKAIKEKDQKK